MSVGYTCPYLSIDKYWVAWLFMSADESVLATIPDMDPRLRDELPDPLYIQLAEVIRQDISAGRFGRPPGRLPTEPKLAGDEFYGVARGTLRRALQRLEEQGAVRVVRGRGTFMVPPEGEQAGLRLFPAE